MRLPPLNSLRVFEAVGRYNSVGKAAEELCITSGAVSRHIKILEEYLAIDLFRRTGRNIVITEAGNHYWEEVSTLLRKVSIATHKVANNDASGPCIIKCPRMFMRNWLLPRLPQFYQQFPDADLRFQVSYSRQELDPSAHCSVRLGDGNWPELPNTFLMNAEVITICSPEYLEQAPPIRSVEDLKEHTLLHSSRATDYWERWLGPAAHAVLDHARNIEFEGDGFDYHGALAGLGIGLARYALVEAEITSGHLVIPIANTVYKPEAYYFTYFERYKNKPNFRHFYQWLKTEAAVTQKRLP